MPRKQYSIGEISKLCNVSKKALRFYEKKGLLSSLRQDYNNYRAYTQEELLRLPVLKYYKQMGFRLEEMRAFVSGGGGAAYPALLAAFEKKLEELQKMRAELARCETSVRDWHELIREAELVLAEGVCEPTVKYMTGSRLFFQEQSFDGDIKSAIINLRFMEYVEKTGNAITGPVYIQFSSIKDRMEGNPQAIRVMQKTIEPGGGGERMEFGGCMMASCYHIGTLEQVRKSYEKCLAWLDRHAYAAEEGCSERYVSDYWTTGNSDFHVTELLIKVRRKGV